MDWYGEQRQRAIEIILNWHGRLNTGDLIAAFGISRIHATKDIKTYRIQFPNNLHYDLSARAYIKSETFKLCLTQGELCEYIDHVFRMKNQRQHVSIKKLPAPWNSKIKIELISKLLWAISEKQAIKINYASMNQPEGKKRVIHPHSLVDTGFRWHVRSYCEEHSDFRDFNLGRILDIPDGVGSSHLSASIENDILWKKEITFNLIANPTLTDKQRSIVEVEFNFVEGSLPVASKACLVHYLLQRYQISSDKLEVPDQTQLLAVANPHVLKPYLFGTN